MDKIGLQLYSIRDVTPRDAAGLREIFASLSDFGYDQIEPAGLPVDRPSPTSPARRVWRSSTPTTT